MNSKLLLFYGLTFFLQEKELFVISEIGIIIRWLNDCNLYISMISTLIKIAHKSINYDASHEHINVNKKISPVYPCT